jgi:hypothetical protein
MGTPFTKVRVLFHKIFFIINIFFPPSCEMLYASRVKLFAEASYLHGPCVSARRHRQNSVLGVHPSGYQSDGSWRALNRDCSEEEGEKIQGADFCG